MERNQDTIQLEMKKARDALAEVLDALSERPQRFVDQCRTGVQRRLTDPKALEDPSDRRGTDPVA